MWCALDGRWLTVSDMSGTRPIALDLSQAQSVMAITGMKRKHRRRVLAGLMTMETAALAALYPPQDTTR